VRRVHEKVAERAANAWFDANVPCLRTKLNLWGRVGWPDQCYWLPGAPLLVEYKPEGGEPRQLQQHIHKQLRESGYEVITCTYAKEAIDAIKARLASKVQYAARQPRAMGTRALHVSRCKVPARKS